MKNYFRLIALFMMLVLFPAIARADVDDGTMISSKTIAPLLKWVEAQTGVHVNVMPTVIASSDRLSQTLRTRAQAPIGRAQALFVGGTILLNSDQWDPEDPRQVSVLVHELVHFAQSYKSNARYACSNQKEAQAYMLQNKWLLEHDERPFVNAAWIDRVSQCSTGSPIISLAQAGE